MLDFKCNPIACGQGHTAAICNDGHLFVWGENRDGSLQALARDEKKGKSASYTNTLLDEPANTGLGIKKSDKDEPAGQETKTWFKAMSVACGQNNTWVVSYKKDLGNYTFLSEIPDECKDIMKPLALKLKSGVLLTSIFCDKNNTDDSKDSYDFVISKTKFIKIMLETYDNLASKQQNLEKLAGLICEHSKNMQSDSGGSEKQQMRIGDIEDLTLGFVQNNVKVFTMGSIHEAQKAVDEKIEKNKKSTQRFEKKRKEIEYKQAKELEQALGNEKESKKIEKKYKQEFDDLENKIIAETKGPKVIKFPVLTRPIVSIAVGFQHCLALASDCQMYSWGCGNYAALGFPANQEGNYQDIKTPTKLIINDCDGKPCEIIQICCGSLHSMCLTRQRDIYSWGEGSCGRLGHEGTNTDIPMPKEIYTLSKRNPIAIAAGEAHSAAISESNQLFTWGQGGFGRLGHGPDPPINRNSPQLVEELQDMKIIDVSLGATHTITVTQQGEVYVFGQNNYGKLGLDPKIKEQDESQWNPIKISMYKVGDFGEPQQTNSKIVRVFAGTYHSVAISSNGKTFTWGYSGRGLLGRKFTFEISDQTANLANQLSQTRLSMRKMMKVADYSRVGTIVSIKNRNSRRPDAMVPFKSKQGFNDPEDKGGIFMKHFIDKINKQAGINLNEIQLLSTHQSQKNFLVQIATGQANTVALTNQGDIFVLGDNNFNQHVDQKEIKWELDDADIELTAEKLALKYECKLKFNDKNITRVPIRQLKGPGDKVCAVACGGGHILVQTTLDCFYGWGRNDSGQIGVGWLSDKILEPTNVKSLSFKGCKQICCSDDYSAACTVYGEVLVSGSVEHGKLGLSGGLKGFQLDFIAVPDLPPIESIAAGPFHMLACSQVTGKTYAWGQNHKGQLGIGSKEKQTTPAEVKPAKEKFKAVACGASFSLGLSESNKVYHWGNLKYSLNDKDPKDILEPRLIDAIEKDGEAKQIACSNKFCMVLLYSGSMVKWGEFLLEKYQFDDGYDIFQEKKKEIERNRRDKREAIRIGAVYNIHRRTNKAIMAAGIDQKMDSISVSVNHACFISKAPDGQQNAYCFGHNSYTNRLGVADEKQERDARHKETLMESLNETIKLRQDELQKQEDQRRAQKELATVVELGSDAEDNEEELLSNDKSMAKDKKQFEEEKQAPDGKDVGKSQIQKSVDQGNDANAGGDEQIEGNKSQNQIGGDNEQMDSGGGNGKSNSKAPSKFSYELMMRINKYNAEIALNNELIQTISEVTKEQSAMKSGKFVKEDALEMKKQQIQTLKDCIILSNDQIPTKQVSNILQKIKQGDAKNTKQKGKQKQSDKKDKTIFVADLDIFDPRVGFTIFEALRQTIEQNNYANTTTIWQDKYEIPHLKLEFEKTPINEDLKPYELLNASKMIQEILQEEDQHKFSEKHIVVKDKQVNDKIHSLLVAIYKYSLIQISAKQWTRKSRSSLQARLEQVPFDHHINRDKIPSLMYKGMQADILKKCISRESNKSKIKQVLSLINLHPCYLVNLLKMGSTDKFDVSEQRLFIKQLYSRTTKSETKRNNTNLLYVFEEMLNHEIGNMELQDVDLTRPDSEYMSVYLFKRIFKSDNCNIDTVASIYCSICNMVFDRMAESDFDIDGSNKDREKAKAAKSKEKNAKKDLKKKAKGASEMKEDERNQILVKIVQEIIKNVKDNNILKEAGKPFQTRKKIEFQQTYVKQKVNIFQNAQATLQRHKTGEELEADAFLLPNRKIDGLDDEDSKKKYPSLKFSAEICQAIKILVKVLKSLPFREPQEQPRNQNQYFTNQQLTRIKNCIAMQVLGLIFAPMMRQINQDMELYILPYVAKAKSLPMLEKQLDTHQINIKNMVHIFLMYLTEKIDLDEQDPKYDKWQRIQELITNIVDSDQIRIGFCEQILEFGSEIDDLRGYKSLENMILHSIEKENTSICISKKLVGRLLHMIQTNQQEIAILNPARNDLLIKLVEDLRESFLKMLADLQDDKFNDQMTLKLKTRLFHVDSEELAMNPESAISKIVRCNDCNAILTTDQIQSNFSEQLTIDEIDIQNPNSLDTTLAFILKQKKLWVKGKEVEDGDPALSKAKKHDIFDDYKILSFDAQKIDDQIKKKLRGKDFFFSFLKGKKLSGFYHFIQRQLQRAMQDKKARKRDAALTLFVQKTQTDVKNMLELEFKQQQRMQRHNPANANESSDEDAEERFMEENMPSRTEEYIWNQIKQIEAQLNKRRLQKFNLDMIDNGINKIWGEVKTKEQHLKSAKIQLLMQDFKSKVMPFNKSLVLNYSYGLANKDFKHMTKNIMFKTQLEQTCQVIKYVDDLGPSKDLMKVMPGSKRKNLSGYLCVEAQELINNKTINKVKLQELSDLMPKSQFIFISDSATGQIEFKIVFKEDETEVQDLFSCKMPKKKVTESELLKVILNPQELMEKKNKIAKKEALKSLAIDDDDSGDDDQTISFAQNDSIIFNSKKFFDLIDQMELQYFSYLIIDDGQKQ